MGCPKLWAGKFLRGNRVRARESVAGLPSAGVGAHPRPAIRSRMRGQPPRNSPQFARNFYEIYRRPMQAAALNGAAGFQKTTVF